MTDDIVERLLSEEDSELATHPVGLLKEAADEIERLRMHTCSYDVATDICRAYKPNVERLARERDEARAEIERLRAALGEITSASNELRNAAPSDYARGFNDGRWRMQQIARAALEGEKTDA